MITLYTQQGCLPCKAVKARLQASGVPFVEKDISTDQEARDFLIFFGFRSVPQLFKDGQHITLKELI